MASEVFWEKRRIHDFRDNIYYIWVVFKFDKFGFKRQLCVAHSEEEFEHYKSYIIMKEYNK